MNSFFGIGVLLAPLLFTTPDVQCREDYPTYCTTELKAMEVAPFHGVLVSPPLASHLYLVEKNEQVRIDAAVKRAVDIKDAELAHERTMRQIEREQAAKQLVAATESFDRERSALEEQLPAWYETPAFLIPVAVLGTMGAIWLAVEVLETRRL